MVVRSPIAAKEDINKALGVDVTTPRPGGFFSNMLENPLFGAGVGVAAMGIGITLLRRGAIAGMLMGQRYFTISLEVPSKDRSYHWVLQWINNTKKTTQHIGVETRVMTHENGSQSTEFDFVPSPGRHYLWFRRNLIIVEREREKSMVDLNSGSPWETVKLTLLGRDPQVFVELLKEARVQAASKQEGKMVIYMPMMTDWRPFGRPKPKRAFDSVILDEGLSRRISNDVQEFQKSGKWYSQRGIPHRRGYLLHGPPGSGKTSFIQALAGELNYNICVLNLNDRGLSDDRLIHLMTEVPPRSFVLLEDIDAVFTKRENTYNVTFSGLLNALDGVTSTEERIVFMTTNHIERLDPALVRPGRVDMKIYVGDSSAFQQRSLYMQFFPDLRDDLVDQDFENDEAFIQANLSEHVKSKLSEDSTEQDTIRSVKPRRSPELAQRMAEEGVTLASQKLADQFVAALHGCTVSMAELQGLLMIHRDQPRNAIDAAAELARFKRLERELRVNPETVAKLESDATFFAEQNKLLRASADGSVPQ